MHHNFWPFLTAIQSQSFLTMKCFFGHKFAIFKRHIIADFCGRQYFQHVSCSMVASRKPEPMPRNKAYTCICSRAVQLDNLQWTDMIHH